MWLIAVISYVTNSRFPQVRTTADSCFQRSLSPIRQSPRLLPCVTLMFSLVSKLTMALGRAPHGIFSVLLRARRSRLRTCCLHHTSQQDRQNGRRQVGHRWLVLSEQIKQWCGFGSRSGSHRTMLSICLWIRSLVGLYLSCGSEPRWMPIASSTQSLVYVVMAIVAPSRA